MTYRELQTALKNLRNAGYDIQVKLTASFDTLQAEYNRLTAIAAEPIVEMTADEFNEWVGLPADVVEVPDWQKEAIANQHDVEMGVESETGSMVDLTYSTNLPKNELYSHQENNQSVVEQEFQFIPVEPRANTDKQHLGTLQALQDADIHIRLEPITNTNKQPLNTTQSYQRHDQVKDVGLRVNSTYWIDGTELGQNLNHTQAQALRNLEDGINWLVKLPGRLKAFESGFREGLKKVDRLRQTQPSQPQVISIHSKRRQPVPMAA